MSMHEYAIENAQGRIVGVADFPDEARDCTERMAGVRHRSPSWSAFGDLLVAGNPSGWRLLRSNHGEVA